MSELEPGDYRVNQLFDTLSGTDILSLAQNELVQILGPGEYEETVYMKGIYNGMEVEIFEEDYTKLSKVD